MKKRKKKWKDRKGTYLSCYIIGMFTLTFWFRAYFAQRWCSVQFSHSVVSDSARPWTAARQASLPITSSRRLLKLMSIESMMPSNHLILCHPLLLPPSIFPASGSFLMRSFFASGGQSIGVSASTSLLPMNIQDWFPLKWTSWISWQFKGLSRVFSKTTDQKHPFFSAQLSL